MKAGAQPPLQTIDEQGLLAGLVAQGLHLRAQHHLGITPLAKGTSGREPLERVCGSIAFGAVARVVLATVKARDPEQPHRLIRAKSNLGLDRGGIEYTLAASTV